MKNSTYHIAIDANEANVAHRVGSNVYAFELLSHLEKMTLDRDDVQFTILLASAPLSDLPKERSGWTYKIVGPRQFWTQWGLPWHLFWHRSQYDVIFSAGHYAPRISLLPSISCVMDLAFLQFPEQFLPKDSFQLREWTRYSVLQAKKVVTISEFSRTEILSAYGKKPEDVLVIPPAIPEQKLRWSEKERMATLKKWQIRAPFFLTVGTLQPRKNIVGMIEAFEYLRDEDKKHVRSKKGRRANTGDRAPMFVIAGKEGWLSGPILRRIARSPYAEDIILTGFVTDAEKAILIHETVALIMFGYHEGFGIPALEALKYGTIPVVSQVTSLPEVVGEAGLFVHPHDPQSLTDALHRVLQLSARERAQLLRKGREQEKKFHWSRSAQRLLELFQEVIQEFRGREAQ